MSAVQLPSTERRKEIEANLADIGGAVQGSSRASSTHPPRLVAVSKYKPASDILAAYSCGQPIPNLWAVETIDSEAKARKLNDAWEGAGHSRGLNVFIQVNTSDEESKGGVEQHDVDAVARAIVEECKGLRLLGLMTIGSIEGSQQRPNPDFLRLRQLRDDLNAKLGLSLELSMGMSDDFEHALELGATNVRVGSRIFGSRATNATQ
ncbi:hypothetical protein GGH91_006101 [Coemansia sp. RSA 2671]|nr:hypothetical protein GGH91_006101 [Coemansia sp. RSA 2671]KAJ2409355.1 hypothetical protein GGI10_004707 [Coemansia sp. RSA 2530]